MQALKVFCDVAALRSFSKAAVKNDITQSAVSQRVRQLEERLGVGLLDRSVRPLELTPAGELLARDSRPLLDQLEELERRVSQLGSEAPLSGTVRVDAIYSAGIGLLNQLCRRFAEVAPGVSIELGYERPDRVAQAVVNGTCDLGILSYPRTWQGTHYKSLRDERMALVCGVDHPLATRQRVEARELTGLPLIGFERDLPVSRAIARYLRQNGVEPSFTKEVDNVDTIKSILAETSHVAILPARTVLREVENGTLATASLEPRLVRPMGVVFARYQSLSPACRRFLEFLLEHAGPSEEDLARNDVASAPLATLRAS